MWVIPPRTSENVNRTLVNIDHFDKITIDGELDNILASTLTIRVHRTGVGVGNAIVDVLQVNIDNQTNLESSLRYLQLCVEAITKAAKNGSTACELPLPTDFPYVKIHEPYRLLSK